MLTAYKCLFIFVFFVFVNFCQRLELHLKAIFIITLQFIIIFRIFKVFLPQGSLMRIL